MIYSTHSKTRQSKEVPVEKNVQEANKTHIDNREGPTETLCFHTQQVFELRDNDVHSRCCSKASHQGLSEVDCHKTKPENTKDKLKERKGIKESIKCKRSKGLRTSYVVLFQMKTLI